jgi:hypothetical protein
MDKTNIQGALSPFALREHDVVMIIDQKRDSATSSRIEPSIVLHHFKDGDHVGEAPMDEIVEGFASGELSEGCLVYDPSADSWELVSSFAQEKSSPDETVSEEARSTSFDNHAPISETEKGNFLFRDGSHSGEAPLDEIVAGFEDGEISDRCEIYAANLSCWVSLSSKMEEMKHTVDYVGVSDDITYPIDSTQDPYDELPFVEKNNHKKPQRGSTEWGKGEAQNLQPVIQRERNSYSTCDGEVLRNPERQKHLKPPPKLMRLVTQAIIQWEMLEEGDRLLFGLSGGKDSMSLLHIMLEMQKKLPIRFEIEVGLCE